MLRSLFIGFSGLVVFNTGCREAPYLYKQDSWI
jgi:hypothetical protein